MLGFRAGELNAAGTEPLAAQRWIDAYNAVYVCNNRIRPFSGTLAELNATVAVYRGTGYEYWIAKAGDSDRYNLIIMKSQKESSCHLILEMEQSTLLHNL